MATDLGVRRENMLKWNSLRYPIYDPHPHPPPKKKE